MIVFVTQLLLMMAGDVERNPGPDEREGDVWIDGGEVKGDSPLKLH